MVEECTLAKVALLIGVGEYPAGLSPLPASPKDVEALRPVLENPEIGGFDRVQTLIDPDPQVMQLQIETWLTACSRDDLALLFFSGHGLKDNAGKLFLATHHTRKDAQGQLIKATAVPASFIKERMDESRCQRQLLILDACFSGAMEREVFRKGADTLNLDELGAKGRVILTSSSSVQYSLTAPDAQLSVYTQYLLEGLTTGAAAPLNSGKISVYDLHHYVADKLRLTVPDMTPQMILANRDEGFNMIVAKAPIQDPRLVYRQEVADIVREDQDQISPPNRQILDLLRTELRLSPQEAGAIEAEVLEPHRIYRSKLQEYAQLVSQIVQQGQLLSQSMGQRLQRLQRHLRLRNEDVEPIIQQMKRQLADQQAVWQQQQELAKQQAQERQRAEELAREQELARQQELDRQQERERQQALAQQQAQERQQELAQQRELQRQQELASQQALQRQRQSQSAQSDSRRRFLQQAGWAGTGLVVVGLGETARRVFFAPKPSPSPSPTSPASQPLAPQSVSFKVVTVDAKGKPTDTQTKQGQQWTDDLGNGVKLELMAIPEGSFLMGSPVNEAQRSSDEGPQHRVTVPGFWMGRYPVTQAQYQAIMGENPSNFKGDNRPVESVTWHQAVEFCKRLSARTGREYRLPSEAEWEYACRAGTTTPFYFGPTITPELVNYNGNFPYGNAAKGKYRQQTTDVGSFPPNAFGLCDMHGNVWEWCADPWHENYNNAPNDGSVWTVGGSTEYRIRRGGSWLNNPGNCRSALRGRYNPDLQDDFLGFRVVFSPPRTSSP